MSSALKKSDYSYSGFNQLTGHRRFRLVTDTQNPAKALYRTDDESVEVDYEVFLAQYGIKSDFA